LISIDFVRCGANRSIKSYIYPRKKVPLRNPICVTLEANKWLASIATKSSSNVSSIGIGIVATMAIDETLDDDLVAIDASHLFASSVTQIGFRKGTFLRGYMYDFIERFAPHLTKSMVDQATQCHGKQEMDELFKDVILPEH
jgi:hypothetical protein